MLLDQLYRAYLRNRKVIHFIHKTSHYSTICGTKVTPERHWEAEVSHILVYTGDKVCKKCRKALDKAGLRYTIEE